MIKPLKSEEKNEIIQHLNKLGVKAGATLYTVLRSRSRSGMNRKLDVYVMNDNNPLRVTYHVAQLTGYTYDRNKEALSVNGCGFDVGFDVAYNLGRTLYPHGFNCLGEGKCPSNDHHNYGPDQYNYNANIIHSDGGYAIGQRWM